MTYEKFKEEVVTLLASQLSEDTQLRIQPVLKNNNLTLDGLLILDPAVNISPTIYLNHYYNSYQEGLPLYLVCAQILRAYESHRLKEDFDMTDFRDFEKAKKHIIFKVISAAENQPLLEKIPFVPYLDLAIVFCYFISQNENNSTILIHHSHLDYWQTNTLEILHIARRNTPILLQPELRPMAELLPRMMRELNIEDDSLDMVLDDVPLYVLSNHKGFLGAATLLYRGLMGRCAEILKTDFYIIPSSVHEVLLVPESSFMQPLELETMLHEVNSQHVAADEVLSEQIYYYSQKDKRVVAVAC